MSFIYDKILTSAIDNVNQRIRLIVVVAPVGADALLSSDIPHVQLEAIAN